jgi:preprotein translocase subunit SecD
LSQDSALRVIDEALTFGAYTIPVFAVSDTNYSSSNIQNFLQTHKQYTTVLASYNLNKSLIDSIKSSGINVKLESNSNMTPRYAQIGINKTIMDSWGLVGLLSAPILNSSITNGTVGDNYQISGLAPLSLTPTQQYSYATSQEKTIMSILNGGALPVSVIVGTPTTIPPTLGKQALYVSMIVGLLSLIAITIFITIRYRKLFLVVPILLTTFTELFIIISIIGLVGTIDLSAVAGMIAVVGTGVDAQIIVTDEILSHGSGQGTAKGILNKAFYIIWASALLLILAMLPLFFSTSLVNVIGFSEATIIGALLGVLVTRPAYGALLSRHFG